MATTVWVGLATRRTDASNYEYVSCAAPESSSSRGRAASLRPSKRQRPLGAESHLPVAPGIRGHAAPRVRRRQPGARASDAVPCAALLSYRAAADYDNVVVSLRGTQTIYFTARDIVWNPPAPNPEPWSYAGGTWQWEYDTASRTAAASPAR